MPNFCSMAVGIALVMFVPLAAVPVGLICVAGALVSVKELREKGSRSAVLGLALSVVGPIAGLITYFISYAVFHLDRKSVV